MALFLSETAQSQEAPVVSLQEAMGGLFDAATAVAELNEAILQADFVIHSQVQGLSEAAATDKKQGFLTNVAGKIKDVLKKVADKIRLAYQWVVEKLKGLWNKLTGLGDKEISVAASALKAIDKAGEAFNKLQAEVAKDPDLNKVDRYARDVAKAGAETAEAIDEMSELVNKEKLGKKTSMMKASQLSGIRKATDQVSKASADAARDLQEQIKAAEKAEAKLKAKAASAKEDAKEEAGDKAEDAAKELAVMRAKMKGHMMLAKTATAYGSLVVAVIGRSNQGDKAL